MSCCKEVAKSSTARICAMLLAPCTVALGPNILEYHGCSLTMSWSFSPSICLRAPSKNISSCLRCTSGSIIASPIACRASSVVLSNRAALRSKLARTGVGALTPAPCTLPRICDSGRTRCSGLDCTCTRCASGDMNWNRRSAMLYPQADASIEVSASYLRTVSRWRCASEGFSGLLHELWVVCEGLYGTSKRKLPDTRGRCRELRDELLGHEV